MRICYRQRDRRRESDSHGAAENEQDAKARSSRRAKDEHQRKEWRRKREKCQTSPDRKPEKSACGREPSPGNAGFQRTQQSGESSDAGEHRQVVVPSSSNRKAEEWVERQDQCKRRRDCARFRGNAPKRRGGDREDQGEEERRAQNIEAPRGEEEEVVRPEQGRKMKTRFGKWRYG